MKILFDTDIGTNIDDSLALTYLLRNPECELAGITTVTGQAGKRAAIARELCEAAGQKVPVRPGSEIPLVIGQKQTGVPLMLDSGKTGNFKEIQAEGTVWEAVHFLRSAIRANPGEITLLTTGPLTNIALLFLLDPEIPSLLKMMVSMAGVYFPETRTVRLRETNIILDPHAAARVLSMSPEITRVVGLDVTLLCMKTGAEAVTMAERFSLPPLTAQLSKWLKKRETVFFHDPLAAVLTCNPELCTWTRGNIHVDTGVGVSSVEADTAEEEEDFPHLIASTVDTSGFFKEYGP